MHKENANSITCCDGAWTTPENSLVAVEGQFDGIFHDATTVAGWERRGGVWQLHAGKSL